MNTKKILILTTNYGDGHIKTAASISNEFKKQEPAVEVEIINLFHESHPLVNKFIKYLYLKCYSKVPQIYGALYYLTKDIKRNFYINNLIGLFGKRKLKRYLDNLSPNIVINTFPVLAMPILYKKGKTKIPCYTIVTDYGVHSQWIDPGVCKYFVGNEYLREQMIQQGVQEERIEVTGIPVTMECENIDKDKFIDKYGLNNSEMPIITLLAGANGVLRNFDKMCPILYNIKPNAQFIIVCGKNEKLKEKMEKMSKKYEDRIKVFGFVDNLHEIMKMSDVVISKAGGITTTEALNMGIPMIIYGTPAGQEMENTKFLIKNECAYYAKNLKNLIEILNNLIHNPDLLIKMKENASLIAKPNGCKDIIGYIFKDLNQKNSKETVKV